VAVHSEGGFAVQAKNGVAFSAVPVPVCLLEQQEAKAAENHLGRIFCFEGGGAFLGDQNAPFLPPRGIIAVPEPRPVDQVLPELVDGRSADFVFLFDKPRLDLLSVFRFQVVVNFVERLVLLQTAEHTRGAQPPITTFTVNHRLGGNHHRPLVF